MNAAQEHMKPFPVHTLAEAMQKQQDPLTPADAALSPLSAMLDSELASEDLDVALAAFGEHPEGRASWHAYQVIGDVLRSSGPVVSGRAPQVFLAGIHARLQAGEGSEAVSAGLSEERPAALSSSAEQVRGAAANDAVFRWKLVAGFASLAAVMAVTWTVLGSAPGGSGGSSTAGPQLALTSPAANQAGGATIDAGRADALQPASGAVVINTAQGPLVRDAQLEALMAEHRQFGGVSALQMPAGFLRNATYDAPAR
jgi:sigma-E factor negative regulatory protein RseA